MERSTEIWSQLNPGTAFAAGLDARPDRVVSLLKEGPELARRARAAAAESGSYERLLLHSLAVQARHVGPLMLVREVLEFTRALIYLGRARTATAESMDAALGAALDQAGQHVTATSSPERILTLGFLKAVQALATEAGLTRTSASAGRNAANLDTVPLDPNWETLLASGYADVSGTLSMSEYREVLSEGYGLTDEIADLDKAADIELASACEQLRQLALVVGRRFPGAPAQPEVVMAVIETARAPAMDALELARTMTRDALSEVQGALIQLDEKERAVVPIPTPDAMVSLITEGEEYMTGGLTAAPQVFCFMTAAKCGSPYTLANVLFHELAHCWNMLKSARHATDLPPTLRVSGSLGCALLEGIAVRREREMFELCRDFPDGRVAGMFSFLGVERSTIVEEFLFDTVYWWVARLVRALFDFRVAAGLQSYKTFVLESSLRTGLSPQRIHGFCYSFFEKPGYAPCYALGALKLDALCGQLKKTGMTAREFNTSIASIGIVPPSEWEPRILSLTRKQNIVA